MIDTDGAQPAGMVVAHVAVPVASAVFPCVAMIVPLDTRKATVAPAPALPRPHVKVALCPTPAALGIVSRGVMDTQL
jgi:hypothetical protein